MTGCCQIHLECHENKISLSTCARIPHLSRDETTECCAVLAPETPLARSRCTGQPRHHLSCRMSNHNCKVGVYGLGGGWGSQSPRIG